MTETGVDTAKSKQGARAAYTVAGILLIIPFFAYIILPLYDKPTPTLFGISFFYWYQTLWLFISAVLFGIAAFIISRVKGSEDE